MRKLFPLCHTGPMQEFVYPLNVPDSLETSLSSPRLPHWHNFVLKEKNNGSLFNMVRTRNTANFEPFKQSRIPRETMNRPDETSVLPRWVANIGPIVGNRQWKIKASVSTNQSRSYAFFSLCFISLGFMHVGIFQLCIFNLQTTLNLSSPAQTCTHFHVMLQFFCSFVQTSLSSFQLKRTNAARPISSAE